MMLLPPLVVIVFWVATRKRSPKPQPEPHHYHGPECKHGLEN